MSHGHALPSHEDNMRVVIKGFILLLIITLVEVGIALIGNGHLIHGFHLSKWIMVPVMCLLSFYKAYYIVSEFMHLGHETRGMAMSVVLPTLLLVWGIIAFLWEGDAWRNNRKRVDDKEKLPVNTQPMKEKKTSSLPLDNAYLFRG
jgi:cytochrome c oxidase subunit IV